MTIATHFVVGAAIVSQVDNLSLALPLAFLSHFVLDVVPHHQLRKYNPWQHLKRRTKVVWDFSWPLGVQLFALAHLILLILFGLLLALNKLSPSLILGGFISILPDAYEWSRFTTGLKGKMPSLHFLHNEKSKSRDTIWGIIVQVVVFSSAVLVLFI